MSSSSQLSVKFKITQEAALEAIGEAAASEAAASDEMLAFAAQRCTYVVLHVGVVIHNVCKQTRRE
jgi:hypothetical protein